MVDDSGMRQQVYCTDLMLNYVNPFGNKEWRSNRRLPGLLILNKISLLLLE